MFRVGYGTKNYVSMSLKATNFAQFKAVLEVYSLTQDVFLKKCFRICSDCVVMDCVDWTWTSDGLHYRFRDKLKQHNKI